ncbi:hypothetical protein [Pedosphaera parvula]|uniref:DUF455 family protein n=1 Tax=Pedosphaera parvula (strain Ellin514) TaxID=320771 RepID=B9XDI3_PEDPL|nr:hypothetical protein [Pedosphaera parvula]EEF62129.1 hypothetical protein Cflav_PD6404 [Pedosphaera parvula Ellin514]
MNAYQTYRNLPALAGICSMPEAMKPGLSVEACVTRLKRYHYAYKRLHEIFTARLTAEPIYELKMGFSLHSHYCAEHVSALRKRVGEMREPPLGLEAIPGANLEIFFDEILCSPTTEELLLGLYEKAVPALKAALEQHLQDTNQLADHPSVRICRFALLEVEEMEKYGRQAIESLVDAKCRERAKSWLEMLEECLEAAGKLDGTGQLSEDVPTGRFYSAKPYKYDGHPKRDERFPDPYNMGVNAEVFLYDEQYPPAPKTLMMFYKRLREIDVPEMMASIIAETEDKPWDYYRDMTRQLWDEARHAMMGEVGFANLGIEWPKRVMVNYTWSLALNTQLKPIERHAVLYFIEQGLMPKTGKRFEWEVGLASQNPLSGLFQDYDWADEVLHARIGRDWYVKDFKNASEAVHYGDECWSRVLMNWESWKKQGLTQHRNWWPEVYKAACERWGIKPDPKVLSYSTTYQTVRADLKNLVGSA